MSRLGFAPRRRRRSRRNPVARRVMRRHYRRNAGEGGSYVSMIKKGAYVVGGMVGTRALTQLLLQTRNTGIFGYAGNLIIAVVGGALISKFAKNRDMGAMFTIGGVGATILRYVQENTPIGSYVSQQLAGMGDYGMGLYAPTTFFTPTTFNDQGRTVESLANARLPAAISQMGVARTGVAGLSGRYGRGRYN